MTDERLNEEQTADGEVFKRVFMAGDVAVTGLSEAAAFLGVHLNTIRRYGDRGLLAVVRLPSGVRRFPIEDLKRLHSEIYGEIEDNP